MRISDWSSDVCSSDLAHPRVALAAGARAEHDADQTPAAPRRRRHQVVAGAAGEAGLHALGALVGAQPAVQRRLRALAEGDVAPAEKVDRTNVVEGKSVSVRVDLGGSTTHKKKN